MKIYAQEGLIVRDPATMTVIPADGLTVSETDPHWSRLLRDGDVTETAPKATAKKDEA
jgi:hypothetical protein